MRKMRLLAFFSFVFLYIFPSGITSQTILDHKTIFQKGESITYEISYNWGFLWVDAGVVNFSIGEIESQGQSLIEFKGIGKTYSKWDWIYKVRDYYHSTNYPNIDLSINSFSRRVSEGKTRINYDYQASKDGKQIYSVNTTANNTKIKDTIDVTGKIHDVLSMIYMARCYDYSLLSKNDSIPITLLLDNQIHQTYIRFMGSETIKIEDFGEIDCYVFRPMLIEGSIFEAGEDMTVWVSKDKNRIPILIETSILVGKIKAIVRNYEGTKYPITFR